MSEPFLDFEPWLRLGAFAGTLAAVALWEAIAPRRPRAHSRWLRWPGNLGILALDAALLRGLAPIAAVAMGAFAERQGWGLLGSLPIPGWFGILAAIVLLDLAIYLQHRVFHAVPALWRLHRMHHADLDFDVTTGGRFHPIEMLLSMAIKLAVVAALGAPAVAVLVFEIWLSVSSLFNHGNLALAQPADRRLRWLVVTPDMHRIHHSVLREETNSNFGFGLPWWDHLFGTYRADPAAGHRGMTIGLEAFRDPAELRIDRMLMQPFR
jgi:sterol desaturase/sphingolipid hydroxylase (fatty acid hydroxylase superfamily)